MYYVIVGTINGVVSMYFIVVPAINFLIAE